MKVSCPSCQTNYNIDDKRIPPGGAKLKCATCQTTFPIKAAAPGPASAAAIPLPGAANASSPAAIPLPGATSKPAMPPAPAAGAIPLPGAATKPAMPPAPAAGAIPLPGAAMPPASASSAIPLPGAAGPSPGAIPLPGAAAPSPAAMPSRPASAAIPLPGAAAPSPAAMPSKPSGGAAIPLPGAAAPFPSATARASGGAIPFPGAAAPSPGAIPLPGAAANAFPDPSAAYPDDVFDMPTPFPTAPGEEYPPPEASNTWESESTRMVPNPLLAGATNPGVTIPLPGPEPEPPYADGDDWEDQSTRVSMLPLPAAAYKHPPVEDDELSRSQAARGDGLPFDPGPNDLPFDMPTRPRSQALDLDAPDTGPSMLPDDDFSDVAAPPPAWPMAAQSTEPDFAELDPLPPPPAEVDFSDLDSPGAPPPAVAGGAFDFEELPLPPSAPGTPPPDDFAFDDFPPPPAASAAQRDAPLDAPLDFDDLPPPPPAGAPDPMLDFADDLPPPPGPDQSAPLDDFGMDLGEPPPAAPAAGDINFDDIDTGAPPPAARGEDPLEFDPSAPSSELPGLDDLEADLSAPIPPSSNAPGNADGLEMLSFIDDSAKSSGATKPKARRYHVRRRSGKVFGPFEEGVVVKMLEDGQLLGNEDVSPDAESWSGMSTVPLFAQTIQKLMESPATTGAHPSMPAPPMMGEAASSPGPVSAATQAAATMDRLKQLYEGRMAAVAVVDRPDPLAAIKKRLPLIAAVAAGVLVLGTGLSFGFSRYGVFGIKKLLPSKVSQGDAGYADVQNARKALLADTFKSYQEAHDLTAKVLSVKEYPEVRATWCQAVFYLQRRYAAASPAELERAKAALEDIELLGTRNVEVVKAFAGASLVKKEPDQALALLGEAKSRSENDKDSELELLVAEALEQKHDAKGAKDALNKVIATDAKSAKALHALGNLSQAAGDADSAAKSYQKALAADPNHVMSAVELAAVELLLRQNVTEGQKAIEQALGDKVKTLLGPAEQARAHTLYGVALASQFKSKEAVAEFDQALKLDASSVFTKAMMGRSLLAQHDYEKALPLLQDAEARDPLKLEYTDMYLQSLIALGKMSDAAKAVEDANKRFPSNARIAYLNGLVAEGADQQADAEKHYKRALAADAKLFEPNLALARLYLALKRVPDAKAQLQEALGKAAEDAAVHAGLGELALAEHDAAKAEEELNKSAQLNPNLAEAHLGLSKVALGKGDLATARAEVDKSLELDKNLKEGRLQRGVVLWKKGDLDGALKELAEAKNRDPKSARVATVTGAVQFDRGEMAEAEKSLLTAIAADSSDPEPHYYLAQVRAKRVEFTQAIESMKNALEHAPNRPDYHYTMGVILRDAKQLPEAMEQWKLVLKLDPNHANAYEALGQAYLDRGALGDAVDSFEAALKADPQRTRILGFVGDCFFQSAKWKDAIERYKAAIKADPNLTYVYYKLGRAYSEQGKHSDAIGWYQKATEADKNNPMPYYYLGYAYKDKGKRKDAVAAFKTYLEKKPTAEDKREIEDEIFDLEQ